MSQRNVLFIPFSFIPPFGFVPEIFVNPCLRIGKMRTWLWNLTLLFNACTTLSDTDVNKTNLISQREIHFTHSKIMLPANTSRNLQNHRCCFLKVTWFVQFGWKIGTGTYLWNFMIFFLSHEEHLEKMTLLRYNI